VTPAPPCGAKTRSGGTCRKPAGWGTERPGFGHCRLHGGATRNGRVHAAKEEAATRAAELGAEAPVDAAEALEYAVQLLTGQVRWLQGQVKRFEEMPDDRVGRAALARALEQAAERLAKTAKLAIDSGLEERRLALDAMVVDRLGAAVSAAIVDADLAPADRQRLDAALRRRLADLNDLDARRAIGP
jgi:hypothetical protein